MPEPAGCSARPPLPVEPAAAGGGAPMESDVEEPPAGATGQAPLAAPAARKGGARPAAGRRRKRVKTAVPGARLEHLMCHLSNLQLQTELGDLEDQLLQQEAEVEDLYHARSEEVMRLSHEASSLRRWLDPGGLQHWSEGGSVDQEWDRPDAAAELAALRQRLRLQRAELQEVRRGALDADEEAASLALRLEVLRGVQEQELRELRLRLPQARRASEAPASAVRAPELQRCHEACEALRRGPGGELAALLGGPAAAAAGAEDLTAWLGAFGLCVEAAAAAPLRPAGGAPADAG
ncbi:unnamed protein product [Prorocentrum cordatum]|uniref:Uncharacterized protein n=1 Tax=Prorocentrum cordatum TaxID=2364126 RepID=A0ABN9UGK0_9DINO|nr:unnamed protein product [Polarella glacialis]